MDRDVLIVGAGPTGLMLAGFLTRQGIRPLVIGKKEGLTEAQSRAFIVVPRTPDTYDMRGIVQRAAAGSPDRGGSTYSSSSGAWATSGWARSAEGSLPTPISLSWARTRLSSSCSSIGGQVQGETSLGGIQNLSALRSNDSASPYKG